MIKKELFFKRLYFDVLPCKVIENLWHVIILNVRVWPQCILSYEWCGDVEGISGYCGGCCLMVKEVVAVDSESMLFYTLSTFPLHCFKENEVLTKNILTKLINFL